MRDHKSYLPLAQKILYELNQVHDVLDNEVIIFWYKKESQTTPISTTIRKSVSAAPRTAVYFDSVHIIFDIASDTFF